MRQAFAALFLTLLVTLWAGVARAQPCALDVDPDTVLRPWPDHLLGLSMEKELLRSGRLSDRNEALVAMLRLLGPGTLRLGGNSVDKTTGYTERDLEPLFALSRATGWPVLYGLNLGADDPRAAAAEARLAWRLGQDRILAFEIGNEPDLYAYQGLRSGDWGVEPYLAQFRAYRAALDGLPLSGPGAGSIFDSPTWTLPFLEKEGQGLAFASVHFYPTVAKTELPAGSPVLPTARNLLSPDITDYIAEHLFRPQVEAAQHLGLPLRVTEANTAARSGQAGVSDAFASALWVVDWTMRLARLGVDGLDLQADLLNPRDLYTPLLEVDGTLTARPLFYGMLLLGQVRGGDLVAASLSPADPAVGAWAVRGDDLQVVVVNKHEDRDVTLEVHAPGTGSGRVLRLEAPSLDAREGVTLGGATVGPDGGWHPVFENATRRITVPAASAVLLELPLESR